MINYEKSVKQEDGSTKSEDACLPVGREDRSRGTEDGGMGTHKC